MESTLWDLYSNSCNVHSPSGMTKRIREAEMNHILVLWYTLMDPQFLIVTKI